MPRKRVEILNPSQIFRCALFIVGLLAMYLALLALAGCDSAGCHQIPVVPDPKTLHPVVTDDPLSWLSGLNAAARNGEWSLVAGFCLLFLTTIADKLVNRFSKRRIPRKFMPWIAIGLGVLTQAGIFLAMGHHWMYALTGGLVAGLVASGGYSAIAKPMGAVLSRPKKAQPMSKTAPGKLETAETTDGKQLKSTTTKRKKSKSKTKAKVSEAVKTSADSVESTAAENDNENLK